MSLAVMDFTHLHLHTVYSMLDGAIRIKDLMDHVVKSGMKSVAMTDHGNICGALEFYKTAKAKGVKPIIGCEFYVSPDRSAETEMENIPDGNAYHLILLAKDLKGYHNLIKLTSRSYTEGFYKKPRIDYSLLEKYSEGLVCLTACLAGEVPRKIYEGKTAQATDLAGRLFEIFRREDFYLEIQDHGIPDQKIVSKGLLELASKNGWPLALTNDSHFLTKDDKEAQDILLRIGLQKKIDEELRFGFNENFYVKSPKEMSLLFPSHPEAMQNTLAIAEKCNLELTFGNSLLPDFQVPEGHDVNTYLASLVEEGLKKKFPVVTPQIRERVDFEMQTIIKMNFAGYFLIVQDYINFARKTGIPVGPGRGSAAGSIVAFLIGMTNVDPLKYNLLFERFLNPDRYDMPDVDTDFCVERREDVIAYIRKKYGEDRVGQIITFSSLASKAALKDVARVLNVSINESNEIAKAFPVDKDVTLIKDALALSADLRALRDRNEVNVKLFEVAEKLEGNYRQAGRHAAGLVISPLPLEDVVPLATVAEKGKNTRSIVTQYDKDNLESIGLIKMDILGLQNLTTLEYAVRLVKKRHGKEILLDEIPLDDPATYNLLKKANTCGIFQLESPGITDLVAKSQVTTFEEIVALIALYRPGPMGSGMLQDYLDRKSGKKKVLYPHQDCEEILSETYGIAVYQEQVMSISRVIGGFTMGESDKLRKAMAKKKPELMEELKKKFIEGAVKKGHKESFASELFTQLEDWAGYGFNKSHSVAYALVTYQTAYMKANYPTEFMTALLASENNDTTKVVKYINNTREMGIKILNPDVNGSEASFSIPEDRIIRFGLSALKGVGQLAAEDLIVRRKKKGSFQDIYSFLVDSRSHLINKKVMEALVQAGAMDSFGYTRKCLFACMDQLISYAQKEQDRLSEGQGILFGENMMASSTLLSLPKESDEWQLEEKLKREKAVTGLFLSGHPLDKYSSSLNKLPGMTVEKIMEVSSGRNVEGTGIISSLELKYTKKDKREFASFRLEDRTGDIECLAFPKVYMKFKELLKEDQAVFIKGVIEKVEVGEAELKGQIIVNSVEILNQESMDKKLEKSLHIKINVNDFNDTSLVMRLYSVLTSFKGNSSVFFHLLGESEIEKKVIKAHPHYSIEYNKDLGEKLAELLGENSVFLSVGEEIRKIT